MCGGQRSAGGGPVPPPIMWVPEVKLRSSGLGDSHLYPLSYLTRLVVSSFT